MIDSDLCSLPAVELARRLRTRQVSAREVLAAHFARIAKLNPKLNAIVTLVEELAYAQAGAADDALATGKPLGRLHGIPVAHKDLQPTRGIRTTFGSRIFRDFVPPADSLLVERIRNAGGVTIGKTNTPEFGAGSQTFNEVFGATLNPYDTTKTCGGSSGGAAVALATGMVPLADGSDLGGSLRNPAAFCNVVGLRPSPGRVPSWPAPLGWSTLSVEGPMARSVADAAFFLSAIAGPDSRSPIAIEEAGSPFGQPLARDFRGVRVAWWKDLGGIPFDPAIRQAVNAQRKVFESLGCVVEEAEPDFTGADEVFKTLRASLFAVAFSDLAVQSPELMKDTILWEVERGQALTALQVGRAEARRTDLFHRMRRFLQTYEFFVLPTTQAVPFDVSQPFVKEIAGVRMETYTDWMKSCYYISLPGNPALSVPCGFTAEGLPVGLQIVGRHREDWGVLQMGHAFEQARGTLAPPC